MTYEPDARLLEPNNVRVTNLSYELAKLPEKDLDTFVNSLRGSGVVSEKEIESVWACVAYFRVLMYPALAAAMKDAMAGELYRMFNEDPAAGARKR